MAVLVRQFWGEKGYPKEDLRWDEIFSILVRLENIDGKFTRLMLYPKKGDTVFSMLNELRDRCEEEKQYNDSDVVVADYHIIKLLKGSNNGRA